ncbi:hypothetical protein [Micromonospora sp. DT47]|uniref:hypothetical protein n=1 Tax=Micromonospora sp. DT47 TaxID=3393431 RepID=UPI003CF8A71B
MPESQMTYGLEHVRVLDFDESVRKTPGMYFGVARENPELATRVLCAVLSHALHPAAAVAPAHTPWVTAQVSTDLAFSVADDQSGPWNGEGMPPLSYYGSLLGPERWLSAAAAALSTRTTVEVWDDGHGFRQELAGLRPVTAPERFEGQAGKGTRVTFELDRDYFNPAAAITTDLASLDLHGPDCRTDALASDRLSIHDLREPT